MGIVEDVQNYLVSEGIVDGTTGWRSSWLRHDESDQLVLLQADGGPEPEIPASEGIGDQALERRGVLVTVRGEKRDAGPAYERIHAIYAALHGLRNVEMGARTYMLVRARSAEPAGPLVDDTGRPEYTWAFIGTASAV